MRFAWVAHALPDEPVEIKQWRTAATDVFMLFLLLNKLKTSTFGIIWNRSPR